MSESGGPLGRAVSAHTQLGMFVETVLQGFGWAVSAKRVHEVLAKSPVTPKGPEFLEKHRRRAEKAEEFAHQQASQGFPYLWYLASVRLWTILEVAVNDLVLNCVKRVDLFPSDSVLLNLEGPLIPYMQASQDERATILVELLKEKGRTRFKPGVARFEALLDPIGLGGPVIPDVRKILLELSEVRHLIVHRNGIVDNRFADGCPWFGAPIGEPLPLLESHFRMYGLALDWYILELDRRQEKWLGRDLNPDQLKLQGDLEKSLHAVLLSRQASEKDTM